MARKKVSFLKSHCPRPLYSVGQVVKVREKYRKITNVGGYSSALFGKKHKSESYWCIGYSLDNEPGVMYWEEFIKPLTDREKGCT